MVEPEVAFADLADNAALAERLLKSVTQRVLNDCENDLGFFQQRIDNTCARAINEYRRSAIRESDLLRRHRYPVEVG